MASESGTIEDHIPKSLDEIIRLRRESFSLRQSSLDEIASLPATIESDHAAIQATIDNWYLICLAYSKTVDTAPQLTHFLLGINRETDCAWMTSAVNAIDQDSSVVRTSNSLYGLGSKGVGHPDLNLILHVCHTLHKWGLGKQLGVLEVFY